MIKKLFVVLCIVAGAARADVVTDWNAIASQVITAGARPGPSSLVDFAVVHVAIYDAVEAIDHRFEPYHVVIDHASGSQVAAAAAAARAVLINRFPSQSASITSTYATYLATRGIAADDPGVSVGEKAAAGIIALRANDGGFPATAALFTGAGQPGMWRPTPSYLTGTPAAFSSMAAPWLADVTPFAVKSASQFRAQQPPALTSKQYADDYNEVKAVGGSTSSRRTQEQTEIAYFWSDNTPMQWHRALRSIAETYVTDIGESARLFALASMAAADAIITCWDTKIHYCYWRPVTAIQEGADDGNPATEPDVNWKPLLNTPNYPDYSSGANNVTGAVTRMLELFFEADAVPFSVTSNTASLAPDKRTRRFNRFSDAASEVVDARIYLGYHFRFADTAARDQGSRVAKWTFKHFLRPLNAEEQPERDRPERP
jgi:hypothetical protein